MPVAPGPARRALRAILLGVAVVVTVGALAFALFPSSSGETRPTETTARSEPPATTSSPSARREESPAPGDAGPRGTGDETLRYVALGDSFTAAPFNPVSIPAGGCMRSTSNYPRLLAQELGNVALVDVSCGGATTEHVLRPQRVDGVEHAPQIDSVTPDTDLVTVSFGLNEFNLYGRLMFRCAALGAQEQDDPAPCGAGVDRATLEREVGRISERVERAVEQVRARAPEAQVVVVSYPQMVSATAACPDRLTLAVGDTELVASTFAEVSRQVVSAAERSGAIPVDLRAASVGHDICSDEPWVNGSRDDFALASAYHPFPVEQAAAAALIADALPDL